MSELKSIPHCSLSTSELLMSSCAGAILTSFFVTPFDVVKTRLQVQAKKQGDTKVYCSPYNCLWDDLCFNSKCILHNKSHLKGTWDAFKKITKYEGVSSLWSGLSPTLVLSVPATVIYFTAYDKCKEKILQKDLLPLGIFGVSILSGVSARILTVTAVCPVEFLRTKMQSEKIKYSTLFQNVKDLVRYRGIFSLWHGWVPTLLRDAPFSAIYWSIYEQLKLNQGHPYVWKSFLFGAFSGSVAATVTLPFDVIKTYRQSELGADKLLKKSSKPNMKSVVFELYKKGGIKSLFAGLIPRLLKVAPACAIMITSYEVGKSFFIKKKMKDLEDSV